MRCRISVRRGGSAGPLIAGIVLAVLFSAAFFALRTSPGRNIGSDLGDRGNEPWFQIQGDGGLISDVTGETKALSEQALSRSVETPLHLVDANSKARIFYRTGGTIEVTGHGDLRMNRDGFATENGTFVARFHKGTQEFKVKVPCAVLGIRGTTVSFSLASGTGDVELIVGEVMVTPTLSSGQPFAMTPGMVLTTEKGAMKVAGKSSVKQKTAEAAAATAVPASETKVGSENSTQSPQVSNLGITGTPVGVVVKPMEQTFPDGEGDPASEPTKP